MRLRDLVDLVQRLDLGEPGRPRRPPRERLDLVRDALARGLQDPDFRLDCIERDLDAWREWESSGWSGSKPPIASVPGLGITVIMFFWPPGLVSPPHEHTSWTMSAVFHNRLEVMTFDWERALRARRLEQRSLFTAEPGRAGYIRDPAIHSPRNPFASGATSFHIYNADDGPVLASQVGPIDGLETYDMAPDGDAAPRRPASLFLGARESVLRLHAEAAQLSPCERTAGVVEEIERLRGAAPPG